MENLAIFENIFCSIEFISMFILQTNVRYFCFSFFTRLFILQYFDNLMRFAEFLNQYKTVFKEKLTISNNIFIAEKIQRILLATLFFLITKKKYFKSKIFNSSTIIEDLLNKISNNICECGKVNINTLTLFSELDYIGHLKPYCSWCWRIRLTKARAFLLINSKENFIYVSKVF